jgi:hypothetical protein
MADDPRLICASSELADGGKGVRFELSTHSQGSPCAIAARCAHT